MIASSAVFETEPQKLSACERVCYHTVAKCFDTLMTECTSHTRL